MIFRWVTADPDSLDPTFLDPFVLATYRFSEYERSYEPFITKLAISKVSKHWNVLATPFLCEYIFCVRGKGRRALDGLARYLERSGGGKWTKRLDLDIMDFNVEWHDRYMYKRERRRNDVYEEDDDYTHSDVYPNEEVGEEEEEEEIDVLYGWQRILQLVPNLVTFTLPNSPLQYPQDWAQQVLFSLAPLSKPNLLRVDWFGNANDISHLHQLSVLCPQLQHVCFTLNDSRDPEISTDAFSISFPQVEALIVQWNPSELSDSLSPPFQPWELPNLKHFTYFLQSMRPLHMVTPIFQSIGDHLRSIEVPISGRSDRLGFLDELLRLLPNLETLIIDLFKVRFSTLFPKPVHPSLKILGWRLRQTGWSFSDIIYTLSCKEYFSLDHFPSLEMARIVHPYDFSEYIQTMLASREMRYYWGNLLYGWVPVVTFEGEPVAFAEYEEEETEEIDIATSTTP